MLCKAKDTCKLSYANSKEREGSSEEGPQRGVKKVGSVIQISTEGTLGKRQYPWRLGTEETVNARQAWHFVLKLLIKEAWDILEPRNHRCHSLVDYLEMPLSPVSQSVF